MSRRNDSLFDAALDKLLRRVPSGACLDVSQIARACGVRDDVVLRIQNRAIEKIKKSLRNGRERAKAR